MSQFGETQFGREVWGGVPEPSPVETIPGMFGHEHFGDEIWGELAIDSRTATVTISPFVVDSDTSTERWIIGTDRVSKVIEEVRNWQELNLTLKSTKETTENILRPLRDDADKLDILVESDGSYRAIDRANGNNTYSVRAPTSRENLRYKKTYLVSGYEEQVVDQGGQDFEVSLALIAESSKTPQPDLPTGLTASNDEWLFQFKHGDVVTRRVNAYVGRKGEKGVKSVSLRMILGNTESRVIEESATKLEAVKIRSVLDGKSFGEDNSSDDTNSVHITPPSSNSDDFEEGWYVVSDWETTWLNNEWNEVNVELLRRKTP